MPSWHLGPAKCLSPSLNIDSSICPSLHLSVHHPFMHQSLCSSISHLSFSHLSVILSVHPCIYSPICSSIHPRMLPSACSSIHPFICLSTHPSIHVSVHPSICPTIYSSSQPISHTFNKYVLSADSMPGPAGQSLLWASCRAGDEQT